MDNDCGAVMANAQQQVAVVKRMVQVAKAIEDTLKKLEPLWSAGTAATSMSRAYQQICGSLNELNGQGEDLGKQIQAIGKILETVNRIVTFVKGANAMCAALMSNPFSMSAARACASATQVQTGTFLSTLTQFVNAVGQLVSAIQQATQGTSDAVRQVGDQLGYDPGRPPTMQPQPYPYPGQTPPFIPQQPYPGQPRIPARRRRSYRTRRPDKGSPAAIPHIRRCPRCRRLAYRSASRTCSTLPAGYRRTRRRAGPAGAPPAVVPGPARA